MENVKSYRDLKVWQRSLELAEAVYRATKDFPKEETYGLTSQIRRSSVSVASNIAEGHGRHTTKQYLQFLGIAKGSLAELETQIILAGRIGFLSSGSCDSMLKMSEEVSKMLATLIRVLNG